MSYNPWDFTKYGEIEGVTDVTESRLLDMALDAGLSIAGGNFDWEEQIDDWIRLFTPDDVKRLNVNSRDEPYVPRGPRELCGTPEYKSAFISSLVAWKRLASEDPMIHSDYDRVVATKNYGNSSATINAWHESVSHPFLAVIVWAGLFNDFDQTKQEFQEWANNLFDGIGGLPTRVQLAIELELA